MTRLFKSISIIGTTFLFGVLISLYLPASAFSTTSAVKKPPAILVARVAGKKRVGVSKSKRVEKGRQSAQSRMSLISTDQDGDGILDDGDFSGTVGDNRCTGGNTAFCDDNCLTIANPTQADGDSDGVGDVCDNCVNVANADQTDSNGDGFGNSCDPDYDNNNAVGISDFNTLRSQFGKTCADVDFDPSVDADNNCAIGISDFNTLRAFFGSSPGPTALNEMYGWAVGGTNTNPADFSHAAVILHTEDGGANWTAQTSDSSLHNAQGVDFSGFLNGWVVGAGYSSSPPNIVPGGVTASTNSSGAAWSTPTLFSPGPLHDVSFVDASHGWAVGTSTMIPQAGNAAAVILHTSDGGLNWSPQAPPSGARDLQAVHFFNQKLGWAVGTGCLNCPALGSDANEPNPDAGSATPLNPFKPIAGVVNPAGDVDFFSFTATAGETVILDIDAQIPYGSGLDSLVTLYDTDGVTVLAQSDDDWFSLDSFLVYTVASSGTFFASVEGWGGSGGPDEYYALTLQKFMFGGDSNEPNNTAATAAPISLPQIVTGTIDPAGDVDFFSFSGNAGDMVDIAIEADVIGSSLDSVLTLYDTDGTTVLATNDYYYSLDARIQHTLPSTGTFFVSVTHFNASEGGSDFFYALRIQNLVGDGLILRTEDGGTNWAPTALPPSHAQFLSDIYFATASEGWAVGNPMMAPRNYSDPAIILHSLDSGHTWMWQSVPSNVTQLLRVRFHDAQTGWAAGSRFTSMPPNVVIEGVILKTEDGGATWTEQTLPPGTGTLTDVFFVNAQEGWALESPITQPGKPGILYSNDGGATWTKQTIPAGDYWLRRLDMVPGPAPTPDGSVAPLAGGTVVDQQLSGVSVRFDPRILPGTERINVTIASHGLPSPDTNMQDPRPCSQAVAIDFSGGVRTLRGAGAKIVFPLGCRRAPGTVLPLFESKDGGTTYSATGANAKVDASGTTATAHGIRAAATYALFAPLSPAAGLGK